MTSNSAGPDEVQVLRCVGSDSSIAEDLGCAKVCFRDSTRRVSKLVKFGPISPFHPSAQAQLRLARSWCLPSSSDFTHEASSRGVPILTYALWRLSNPELNLDLEDIRITV